MCSLTWRTAVEYPGFELADVLKQLWVRVLALGVLQVQHLLELVPRVGALGRLILPLAQQQGEVKFHKNY